MKVQEFLQPIIEQLQRNANVRLLYGEPIEAKGKMIIPVAEIKYGFGGGGREKGDPEGSEGESGLGGGGGMMAHPSGIIEITDTDMRYIDFQSRKKMGMALTTGLFVGLIVGGRRSKVYQYAFKKVLKYRRDDHKEKPSEKRSKES